MIYTAIYQSPCGELILGDYDGSLCLCDWYTDCRAWVRKRVVDFIGDYYRHSDTELLRCAANQLDEYFNGQRHSFSVPLLMCGTPFQKKVWTRLLEIEYGSTITYGQLADRIDMPNGSRAVASAARANAISIIVPCHRVIGAGNRLTGYAGGLDAKTLLLNLELSSG